MRSPRTRLVTALVAVVLVLVAGVLVGLRIVGDRGSALSRAVAMAPQDGVRFSWTDWAGVRAEVGQDASEPTADDVTRLLRRAYDADLSSSSALVESAVTAQAQLGFSPANASWELFSQGDQGALVTIQMPEDTDFASIAAYLERSGFTPPAEADGAWDGGPDVLAALGTLTPELSYVALDEDAGVIRTSDQLGYLTGVLADDPTGPGTGITDVVDAVGSPLTAAVYDGPVVCESLAMASADRADQEQARTLVAQAGEVNPLTAFALGQEPGGDVRIAMAFETDDQARRNADSRAELAAGPAPGQGGSFPDRFRLDRASATGRVVTLEVTPAPRASVVSDLTNGPVLFATC